MISLLRFFLTLLVSPLKSKSRLKAENAALRHQLTNPRPPRDFGNSVDHQKSVRPFKGIFCRDISEFEFYMPSQAVRSPEANM